MAENSYPRFPEARWWALRRYFKRTMPSKVTNNLLCTVLSVAESSAKQVLASLRALGLVAEDGSPTQLLMEWRDDESYGAACATMRKNLYPSDLIDAFPVSDPERGQVQAWFARATATGQANAAQMAGLYLLLSSGKVSDESKGSSSAAVPRTTTVAKAKETKARVSVVNGTSKPKTPVTIADADKLDMEMPQVQVAVQVNLHPDMTADQIDHVFRSMAEHLYRRPG